MMTVPNQVDWLIKQATSPNNLVSLSRDHVESDSLADKVGPHVPRLGSLALGEDPTRPGYVDPAVHLPILYQHHQFPRIVSCCIGCQSAPNHPVS